MKRLCILALALGVTGQAAAADRLVRIFHLPAAQGTHIVTGQTLTARSLLTILFLKEPCPLPLADKANMLRAWMAYATNQLGCWYPTIDDGYVFVGSLAMLTHAETTPWESFPRALLHPDGSATITEPGYDSATFSQRINDEKVKQALARMRPEKP